MNQGGTGSGPERTGNESDAAAVERTDGRPTDVGPATPHDSGRPSVARTNTGGPDAETAQTVAPEEKGEEPETEHAPGGDL